MKRGNNAKAKGKAKAQAASPVLRQASETPVGCRTPRGPAAPIVVLESSPDRTVFVETTSTTPAVTTAPAGPSAAVGPPATPTTPPATVAFNPDVWEISTPPASRSGSRQLSPFTKSPLLRGPGHLDEEGYDFHRIVKAKKTDETTTLAMTDTPSAFTTPSSSGACPRESQKK